MAGFKLIERLPKHIIHQIEEEREAERKEQERLEWEKNHCKVRAAHCLTVRVFLVSVFVSIPQFRLFCRHPLTEDLSEVPLEVHKDIGLNDVIAKAHKVCNAWLCLAIKTTSFHCNTSVTQPGGCGSSEAMSTCQIR